VKSIYIFIFFAIFIAVCFFNWPTSTGNIEQPEEAAEKIIRVITAEPMDTRLRHERSARWVSLIKEIEDNKARYILALEEQFSGEEGDPLRFREEKKIILSTAKKHLAELLVLEKEHSSSKSSLVEIRRQKYRVDKLIEDISPYAR
jgi:hypothetical protein